MFCFFLAAQGFGIAISNLFKQALSEPIFILTVEARIGAIQGEIAKIYLEKGAILNKDTGLVGNVISLLNF